MDAVTLRVLLLLLLVGAAVVLDFLCYRISNRLIVAGYILAVAVHLAQDGMHSIFIVLWNISFPVIILYLFYRMRAIGAGDVKLFSMIGGFVTFHELVFCIVFSFVAGAILSFGKMLYFRTFFPGIRDGAVYIRGLLRGEYKPYKINGDVEKHTIHFSLAILLGTVATIWYGRSF